MVVVVVVVFKKKFQSDTLVWSIVFTDILLKTIFIQPIYWSLSVMDLKPDFERRREKEEGSGCDSREKINRHQRKKLFKGTRESNIILLKICLASLVPQT